MKIAPLKVSDPWYGRILSDGRIQVESLRSVPIESTVEMELVELLHGGAEENYRPYLHLRGELTEAVPAVELPYGVSELALRRGAGLSVDAFYEFNQHQLHELVGKGYFTEQFRVPDEMSGIPWVFPGHADFLVVAPEYSDQPPLVFMDVLAQNELELDKENSGYDLSSYFPDFVPESEAQAAAATATDDVEYGGSGLDVFADEIFEERQPITEARIHRTGAEQDVREPVPSGIFERLMSEIDARRVVEPEIDEEAPELEVILPGSPADLYNSRVSPGVDQVLSGDRSVADGSLTDEGLESIVQSMAAEEPAPAGDFLDFNEPDTELEPPAFEIGEGDPDAHHKAAVRRTARIRSELIDAETPTDDAELHPGI